MEKTNKMNNKNLIKNIKKWYSNRNRLERTLIWSLTALFFISLLFNAAVQGWNGYHGLYIDKESCIETGKLTAISLDGYSEGAILLILFLPIIKWIGIAIGIAWILHGVQFRILA